MIAEIHEYIHSLQIIDTHEHLPPFENQRRKTDFLVDVLPHYASVDLVSAGLSPDALETVRNTEMPIMEKWAMIEPYWPVCRFTGYGQALRLIARDLYGIDEINRDTISRLNDRFLDSFEENGYEKILKEKSNIRVTLLDRGVPVPCDDRYFIPVGRIDPMVYPRLGAELTRLEKASGISLSTFDHYLRACQAQMAQFAAASNILKCGLAYFRTLDFARCDRGEAERGFNKLFRDARFANPEFVFEPDRAFSNYMFHYILGLAQDHKMVMQIHTGILEGNNNLLENARPLKLNEVFRGYPAVKFDVFHIGYPFQHEVGLLCKMFPNVSVDFCWAYVGSPVAARQTLSEWLELIPYTKICGFGGDYVFPNGVYAHQLMARDIIAEVLSEKVERRLFSPQQACEIGKALLYDNPVNIFSLQPERPARTEAAHG